MPNYVKPKTSRCGKIIELLSFSSARTSCYFSFSVIFSSVSFSVRLLLPCETKYFFLFLLACKPHIFVLQIFSFSKQEKEEQRRRRKSFSVVLLLHRRCFSSPNTFSPLFLLCFSCPPNIFRFQIFSSFSFSSANQMFSNFSVEKFEQNPQFLYALFEELSWYSCLFLRAK